MSAGTDITHSHAPAGEGAALQAGVVGRSTLGGSASSIHAELHSAARRVE